VTAERVPFEALDDYQSGEMPEDEAARFEEDLFLAAADGTADEATFVDEVTRIARYLYPRGGLDTGSSRARVDELIGAGYRVQVLEPEPGPVARLPKIRDDAEIVVTHVPIDVRGYDSVDVVIEKEDGTYLKTFREVGFDPLDGTIYAVCEAPLARISMSIGPVRTRLLGYRGSERHVIAELTAMTEP
jgi:hypothetical protein